MPLRITGYDYSAYKKQYDKNAKNVLSSGGTKKDEFLSRMKKTDKFMPVITIVIYYGEKPWDGARSLHEMLNIPEEMETFVNDYPMIPVEARENDLVFHNTNNADFFHMMKLILDQSMPEQEAKAKVINYAREHDVDKAVIMTLAGTANCKIDYCALSGREDFDMGTLFERIAKESEVKGKAEGIIETGFECGLSEHNILEKLQKKLNVTLQKAEEYLKRFEKQTIS